jgi:hypothetical protein
MSIVRMGMSEDDKFGAGYDAIFGPKPKKAKAAKKSAKEDKKKDEKKKDEKKK